MIRRTKVTGQVDTSIAVRDLTVTGALIGPQFATMMSAIDALTANDQRFGQWVVGSSVYKGRTQFTCTGAADQVKIQAAITACVAAGGGTVWLTEGTFYLTAAIDLSFNNVTLRGAGPATILKKNCNDYAIKVVGTTGTHISGVIIRDLTITRDPADTNMMAFVYCLYADVLTISGLLTVDCCDFGVFVVYCFNGSIRENTFTGTFTAPQKTGGVSVSNCNGIIVDSNHIYSLHSAGPAQGIYLYNSDDAHVINNQINDIQQGLVNGVFYPAGIWISGTAPGRNRVMNNRVIDTGDFATRSASDVAIRIDSNAVGNVVVNNFCADNGNLIDRGNCESATDPCITGQAGNHEDSCTFTRTDAATEIAAGRAPAGFTAHNGSYLYMFKKTSAAGASAGIMYYHDHDEATTNDMAGIVAGCTYSKYGWVYVPTLSGIDVAEVGVYADDAVGGVFGALGHTHPTGKDAWEQVLLTFTVRATATGFALYLAALTAAALNEYFYVDDIRLRPDGVSNEHSQNFSDAGTGALVSGNSWQNPFPA
jgi:hypothetical protein